MNAPIFRRLLYHSDKFQMIERDANVSHTGWFSFLRYSSDTDITVKCKTVIGELLCFFFYRKAKLLLPRLTMTNKSQEAANEFQDQTKGPD